LAEPGTLVEPVEAQAEELSAESLRIASQLAEGYRVSPLHTVPHPTPPPQPNQFGADDGDVLQ